MTDLPRIAIVGSPNVGKSTLFNRLIRQRKAITDPTPGVTRDSVESVCTLEGRSVLMIDTGGYRERAEGPLQEEVSRLSVELGGAAQVILLVVDVGGITPDDAYFIEKMRRFQDKVILVANKVDNDAKEPLMWNLFEFGFPRVVGVSAAHGRNIDALQREILDVLGDRGEQEFVEREPTVRIAILGKPNTGKSTLSNRLLERQRSLVAETPGTTRDVVEGSFFYKGESFQVLDTAGIRRKSKVKEPVEYYSVNRALGSIRRSDIVFLLIDAATGLTDQDKKISAQVMKEGRGIILVLNKWDLLEPIPNRLRSMQDRITFQFPVLSFAPVVALSALTGHGVAGLLNLTLAVRKQLERRVGTPELNRWLRRWTEEHPLRVRGKTVAIRYAAQVATYPSLFLFFAARKKGVPRAYERYLANKIREDLGLELIPLRVEIRGRE